MNSNDKQENREMHREMVERRMRKVEKMMKRKGKFDKRNKPQRGGIRENYDDES